MITAEGVSSGSFVFPKVSVICQPYTCRIPDSSPGSRLPLHLVLVWSFKSILRYPCHRSCHHTAHCNISPSTIRVLYTTHLPFDLRSAVLVQFSRYHDRGTKESNRRCLAHHANMLLGYLSGTTGSSALVLLCSLFHPIPRHSRGRCDVAMSCPLYHRLYMIFTLVLPCSYAAALVT